MDSIEKKGVKIVFFGAGRIGRYWLEQSRCLGVAPEGIFDNNEALWETMCDDIMIHNPEIIKNVCCDYIFITCNRGNEILQQLLNLGIAENKIVAGHHNILNHLLFCAVRKMSFFDNITCSQNTFLERKIIFDLYNGMVLGGVESWSYALARRLHEIGYCGLYLTTDAAGPAVADGTYPVYMLKYHEAGKEKDKVKMCVEKISEHLPCTIVCNFPQHIFWAACIAKNRYPEQIKIVAVQHSDDQPYYNVYSLWQKYVNQYMVISSRIEQKLLACGVEQDKIGRLEWSIPCKGEIERTWGKGNTCLRIGYAGRVTVVPKRIDLFLSLAENLKRKGLKFQINIAGTGDYSEKLQDKIRKEGFQDCMFCVGYIDRKDIPKFWSRQDIMISCSEYEGHSISQSEAMAEGAVPVITDVSGARDDVTDGYNGYVVAVGDIDALADRIQELYLDRDKLEQMGKCAHNTIYERQKRMDQGAFWDDLIKKVWEQ